MRYLSPVTALFLPFLIATSPAHAKSIRHVALGDGDVGTIRTTLGYSTILEFDAGISGVIVGDQDAFKVEGSGTSLAIKPLVPHATSNLFVVTEYERFSFRLIAEKGAPGDFVVHVEAKRSIPNQRGAEVPRGKTVTAGGVTLSIDSEELQTDSRRLVVGVSITGPDKEFQPGDIGVFQSYANIQIENLYLDELTLSRRPVKGLIVIDVARLRRKVPLTITFKPDFLPKKVGNRLRLDLPLPKTLR